MKKTIVIIGAGNVGTFLTSAILTNEKTDKNLVVIENSPQRLATLQSGIAHQIKDLRSNTFFPHTSSSAQSFQLFTNTSQAFADNGVFDTVFITTKSYDLSAQFYKSEIEPFLREESKVVLLQNGWPNPELLKAIGSRAVIMVVNAGFSLSEDGVSYTNKAVVDVPYGSLVVSNQDEMEETIGKILAAENIQVRYNNQSELIEDIAKKTQYACIGALCAVEAFKKHHAKEQKFTFKNLVISEEIFLIAQEIREIFGAELLSNQELVERIKVNAEIENSLVSDARNGRKIELEIVENILALAQAKSVVTPSLDKLFSSLKIIASDQWQLIPDNVEAVKKITQNQSSDIMTNFTEEYVVIAIYGGAESGEKAISKIDGTPGYLHLHAIKTSELERLPTIPLPTAKENADAEQTIYQWGLASDKDLGVRAPIVSINDIISYGNLGVGSGAIGDHEEKSSFVGGGEVFIVPALENEVRAFRITKGQGVFPMSAQDQCWTFEVTSDAKAMVIPIEESKQNINSRSQLLKLLQEAHGQGDINFIAKFKARFNRENFAARSNGVWPLDDVAQKDVSLFSATNGLDPVGGHLLGDSNSEGDKISNHKGVAPISDAAISLKLTDGIINIAPTAKKLIAHKENPHEFREPLLQEDLTKEISFKNENHVPVVVMGGGIAAISAALKLAKIGIPSCILEQNKTLLSETSGITPGRIGHGYHYRDLETAKTYLQSSITFLREFCKTPKDWERLIIKLGDQTSELDYGLYFIHKDSQVRADNLLEVYRGIQNEYRRLVALDPANKILGEPDEFFQELNLRDFSHLVDISQMGAVIRTKERLLNWPEFNNMLMEKISYYQSQGLISVLTERKVTKTSYESESRNRDFQIEFADAEPLTTSYIVNATWTNIEELDSNLFPESAVEERTNRIKLIASIKLPLQAQNAPSMFTAMGPFTMFSNEGNGNGKTTFAPVTNMLDYVVEEAKKDRFMNAELQKIITGWFAKNELIVSDQNNPESWAKIEMALETQPLYKRWISQGLNAEEQEFFGKMILNGTVNSYPILAGSEIVNVGAGIVKSNGEVNIRDANSSFHKRSEHGLKERQISYIDFNGVKLFYAESQARNVAETIISHIRSNIEIEKEVAKLPIIESPQINLQRESAVRSWVSRYGMNQKKIADIVPNNPQLAIATQDTVSYLKDVLNTSFDLYLKQPRFTGNVLSQELQAIIRPIVETVKNIQTNFRIDEDFLVQKNNKLNPAKQNPFTVFSMINRAGDIILDGKYGFITPEKRDEHNIPSLANRDYVKQMLSHRDSSFFCGSPVVGSTSHEFMIPVGIKLNEEIFLTFGMNIPSLMKSICTRQADVTRANH